MIAVRLLEIYKSAVPVAIYVALAAMLTIIGVLMAPETRGRNLEEVGRRETLTIGIYPNAPRLELESDRFGRTFHCVQLFSTISTRITAIQTKTGRIAIVRGSFGSTTQAKLTEVLPRVKYCLPVLLSTGVCGDGLSFHSPDDSWDNKPNECKAPHG